MIEKLTFKSPFVLGLIENGQLKDELPHLTEVFFTDIYGTYEESISEYLPHIDFLKSFSFYVRYTTFTIRIRELVEATNKWRFSRSKPTNIKLCKLDVVTLKRIDDVV